MKPSQVIVVFCKIIENVFKSTNKLTNPQKQTEINFLDIIAAFLQFYCIFITFLKTDQTTQK